MTTLIEEFRYPRLGPGEMWERFHERVEQAGMPLLLNHRYIAVWHKNGHVESVVMCSNGDASAGRGGPRALEHPVQRTRSPS